MRKLTTIFGLTILLMGCNFRNDTGSFWMTFEKKLIVKNESDQGGHGGHRRIHWTTGKPNTFNSKMVIELANKNGWIVVDSSKYQKRFLKDWTINNAKIFPAVLTNFTPVNDSVTYDLPRWIDKDLTVYKFKTGLCQYHSGTNDASFENGFALLSDDGTELSIYHFWGD